MKRAFPLCWGQVGGSLALICLKTIRSLVGAAVFLASLLGAAQILIRLSGGGA